MIDRSEAEKLAMIEDEQTIEEAIDNYNMYFYFEALLMFYTGYVRRPVQSLSEVKQFIRFIVESNKFDDDEKKQKMIEVLETAEESITRDFVNESGIDEQEFLIKAINEYQKGGMDEDDDTNELE